MSVGVDHELLSSVKWSRMGSGLNASVAAADESLSANCTGLKVTSDALLRMASFVGVVGPQGRCGRAVDPSGNIFCRSG